MDPANHLHLGTEPSHIGIATDYACNSRRSRLIAPVEIKISRETTRIVAQAIVRTFRFKGKWAQRYGVIVGKWSRINTAATGPWLEYEIDTEGCGIDGIVWNDFAITAHRSRRAVEDRRLCWILPIDGPVPIWLRAFIAAFILQRFLVEVHEITMEDVKQTLLICQPKSLGADA